MILVWFICLETKDLGLPTRCLFGLRIAACSSSVGRIFFFLDPYSFWILSCTFFCVTENSWLNLKKKVPSLLALFQIFDFKPSPFRMFSWWLAHFNSILDRHRSSRNKKSVLVRLRIPALIPWSSTSYLLSEPGEFFSLSTLVEKHEQDLSRAHGYR